MTKTNVQLTPSNSQHHDTPNNKTHIIKFRVTAEEKTSLELTCKLLNLSLSTFIRRAIHNVKIEKTVIVAGGGEETLNAVSTLLAQCSNMNTNSRNVTYSTVGDYQLPNLTLNQPRKPLGKYGRLRRTYLKDHRPVLYNTMLLSGSLYPHLLEVEQNAAAMKEHLMTELLVKNPAPDKEQTQMAWVQHMNSLKAQAEELVLTELIYS